MGSTITVPTVPTAAQVARSRVAAIAGSIPWQLSQYVPQAQAAAEAWATAVGTDTEASAADQLVLVASEIGTHYQRTTGSREAWSALDSALAVLLQETPTAQRWVVNGQRFDRYGWLTLPEVVEVPTQTEAVSVTA